jgi:hypothetical protein
MYIHYAVPDVLNIQHPSVFQSHPLRSHTEVLECGIHSWIVESTERLWPQFVILSTNSNLSLSPHYFSSSHPFD